MSKVKVFHALAAALGLEREDKITLVRQVSAGREESSANLTEQELDEAIETLRAAQGKPAPAANDPDDKMRKKVIGKVAQYMGMQNGLDMPRIHAFVQEVGYLKKPLNDYTHAELMKLVSQMQQIAKKDSDAKRKAMKVVK